MSRPSWYRINAEGTGAAIIYLYGAIGQDWWGEGNAAIDFAKELDALSPRPIELRVNSEGGDVFEGYAIYSTLIRYPGRVTAFVDGLAASAASVIVMAADELVMGEPAFLMIHNAWSIVLGNAQELRDCADRLDAIDEQMVAIYEKSCDKSADEIRAAVEATTWLNAEQALEWGFADRIEESLKAAACITRDFAKHFASIPAGVQIVDALAVEPLCDAAPTIEPVSAADVQEPPAEDVQQEPAVARTVALASGVYSFQKPKE